MFILDSVASVHRVCKDQSALRVRDFFFYSRKYKTKLTSTFE